MANNVDSELTAAVTDPSSGVDSSGGSSSVAESKEKNVKTKQIQKSPQTGSDPPSVPEKLEEWNDHKYEKSKEGVDSSGGSSSVAESKEKDGVDSSGGSSSVAESKEKDVKTTQIQKSPQTGSDPPSVLEKLEEENDHKPEKSKEGVDSSGGSSSVAESKEKDESLLKSQRPARDINESGDRFNQKDEANAETGENEDQVQDADAKQGPESSWKGDSEDNRTTTRRRKTESLQHTISPELPQERQSQISVGSNNRLLWIAAAVVVLVLVICKCDISDSTPSVPKEFNVVDVFNQEMEKLKTSFPNQRPELWRRSLIHLRRHLKTEHPTEPVSLILTSGHRAERTLGCLARCLAQAFSTARNSSVLNINGKSKSTQDSDQVKLDIDSELKNAFEGKKFAAVIHRFEELPPGSTLIFYRYCDHENAAYKNVFLAFTVMLDAEVEVPSNVSLGRVEEMVQEHVKQKFVSSDKLANFNQMDVDKLSGLWSRISHLILPVAAEAKIEHQGCRDCDKSL